MVGHQGWRLAAIGGPTNETQCEWTADLPDAHSRRGPRQPARTDTPQSSRLVWGGRGGDRMAPTAQQVPQAEKSTLCRIHSEFKLIL